MDVNRFRKVSNFSYFLHTWAGNEYTQSETYTMEYKFSENWSKQSFQSSVRNVIAGTRPSEFGVDTYGDNESTIQHSTEAKLPKFQNFHAFRELKSSVTFSESR